MMTRSIYALITAFALLLPPFVHSEQLSHLGDWDVHYSAFGSTFLSAPLASRYAITRSRYTGILNITVLDARLPNKPAKTVTIKGVAKNLLGNSKPLTFREINEQNATYYIAQFDYRNEETYQFIIDIRANGKERQLKFSQRFFVDER
jgi:hypothetical protein